MATWKVAVKRRVTPPLTAGILGHFTGTLLNLQVVGEVSPEAINTLKTVLTEDRCGNLVINADRLGDITHIIRNLSDKDREVLEKALSMLNDDSEILILKEHS